MQNSDSSSATSSLFWTARKKRVSFDSVLVAWQTDSSTRETKVCPDGISFVLNFVKCLNHGSTLLGDENKARAKELSQHITLMDDAIRRILAGGSGTSGFIQELRQQVQESRAALNDGRLSHRERLDDIRGDPSAALGTLRKLRADIQEDYQGILQSEKQSAAEFMDLEMSKQRERRSLQQQVQQKGSQLSDLKIRLVQLKKDLEQTDQQLQEDQQTLSDLKDTCQHKSNEWQKTEASRDDELAAIAETQTLLGGPVDGIENSPNAGVLGLVDLSLKVNSLSLLQLRAQASAKDSQTTAGTGFLWLAMQGSRKGLEKVVAQIDKFVSNLEKEESAETQKKLYCQMQYKSLSQKAAELSSKHEEGDSMQRRPSVQFVHQAR